MARVKICGIKNEEDLKKVVSAGADAVGFIVDVPVRTPRKIDVHTAKRLISKVPIFVTSVAVIMPKSSEEAITIIEETRPSAVQIHNRVPVSFLKEIKEETGIAIIKTIGIDSESPWKEIREAERIVDGILLDTIVSHRAGGTGITHNWEISAEIVKRSKIPVILAGGITPENVRRAILRVRPFAVDVASGVETGGRKDDLKVKKLISEAHSLFQT
ncbi:MAG: phosphoribosylanthranilate isomerase [Candidatus Syntropharchaeia archaeon]